MSERKVIAVVGATGAQGGGLVRAILSDPSGGFAARAVTRDVNSDKAKALAALGAEVVEGDVGDVESLTRAFTGAYGAFCVTFFWDHFSPEKEKQHARAMADAAKRAGVKHVIWSTLEDTRQWVPTSDERMPTLHGEYSVPHFDAKGESNAYFDQLGLPVTHLNTSFYWENFFRMGPQRGPDGALAITFPLGDKRMPGIAVEDIGKCAYGVFKAGQKFIGKTIGIAGQHLSGAEMAASLTKALGQPVRYQAIEPADYRALGFPGADDLGNMFQVKRDFEAQYTANRDLAVARELNPALETFDSWLAKNKSRIPIA